MDLDRKKFASAERREEIARQEASYVLRIIALVLALLAAAILSYIYLR